MDFKTAAKVSIASLCITHVLFFDLPDYFHHKYDYVSFSYETDSQGQTIASGHVKHEVASKWLLVELRNVDGEHELVVINKEGVNVLTGKFVSEIHVIDDSLVSLEEDVIYIENLSPYLIDTERQDFYNSYDLERIIDLISENYTWHKEKVLKISN